MLSLAGDQRARRSERQVSPLFMGMRLLSHQWHEVRLRLACVRASARSRPRRVHRIRPRRRQEGKVNDSFHVLDHLLTAFLSRV